MKIKSENNMLEIYKECAREIDEKKGTDIILLDLRDVNSYLDYFLIATGNSHVHCRSLAKAITKKMGLLEVPSHNKPDLSSGWIVLDYSQLIIHIFTEEMREFYQLEKLWADAKVIDCK